MVDVSHSINIHLLRIIQELLSVGPDSESFQTSVDTLASKVGSIYPVRISTRIDSNFSIRNAQQTKNLYYSISESLKNAVRHAEPTQVDIALQQDRHGFFLTITNDGQYDSGNTD